MTLDLTAPDIFARPRIPTAAKWFRIVVSCCIGGYSYALVGSWWFTIVFTLLIQGIQVVAFYPLVWGVNWIEAVLKSAWRSIRPTWL
jgi:hypothetical protein